MNQAKWKKTAVVSALISLLVLTACSNKGSTGETNSPAATNQAAESAAPVATIDPLGKYDPPIEVSTVKSLDDASMKFATGESIDNNVWTKAFQTELGINLKVEWLVPVNQYEQKLNVTIASNELPDITLVSGVQLKQLVDNGMIEDMTQAYKDTKSEFTNEIMTADGGLGLKQATFGGKLMAIPQMNGALDSAPIMWIRKDWLDAVGLQPPKTMDDVFNIAKAFTENDPDKNNKKDTFGLGLEKGLLGSEYDLNGFFNGYHAPILLWTKDNAGKLIPGETMPEAKAALAKLAEMYKAGYIDREFSVKDAGKVSESVVSQKIGMFYGAHWNVFYPLPDAVVKNPQADWRAYPIASVDGNITAENTLGVSQFFVVKKGMKHPEAAVKLLNYFLAKENATSKDYEMQFHFGPDYNLKDPAKAVNEYQYAPIFVNHPQQNILIYRGIVEYGKSKDVSKLSGWAAKDEKSMKELDDNFAGIGGEGLAGNVQAKSWANWLWNGPYGAYSVIAGYLDNKQIMSPVFYGAPTPTMTAKQSTLAKMTLEEYTKIIMGAAPIDDFDKYVENWNKLGGADITKEVNDWVAAQK